MDTLVKATDIKTTFPFDGRQRIQAVNGVSIEIAKGEVVGLVGESGSGKSVTAKSILQLIQPPGRVEGDVRIDGYEGNTLEYGIESDLSRTIRGGKIGMIFQEPMTSLNPILTVGYQIEENIMTHLGIKGEEAKQRTIDIMRQVGIANPDVRYNQYPTEFSGGMRQRIMIAMVLAAEPELLVADEATTALDVTTQAQILELIQKLAKERNLAVIIVTHNLGLVARYADRIYVMYCGNVVEATDKYTLFANPIHPYTRGLLAAVPRLDDDKSRMLVPIDGIPPTPINMPPYCRFYERCKYREEKCTLCECDLKEFGDNHFVRCMLTQEELDEKQEILKKEIKLAPEKTISEEISLEVENLKIYFPIYRGLMKKKVGEVKAVEDVSLNVHVGETLGVVGESGCGKSTLAKGIMRAVNPKSGRILYKGKDILKLKNREMKEVHSRITMIFQDPYSSLDPRQTAGSIVGEPLLINKITKSKEEYDARVDELFRIVGLDPSYRTRVPREFSGGQRQRLGIARALASNPDVIICDEPVSALDVSIQAQIINLLEDLQAKLNISYIFIAHDLSVVKHISDRIVVMYLGKIVETARAEELYEHPMHPYTQALLSAVPIADPKADSERTQIKLSGEIPSVLERPSGCPFSSRCPHATEHCRQEIPHLTGVEDEHSVACFLYETK